MSRPATFKVDNTVYWVIRTYTDAGVLVDADSTPTVAVRKNGSSTADSVTVTKRAATTGIYDCSYNPASEVEGDLFTIEETATISAQAYENSWGIEALAAERGTDGANTVAPDNAGITANGAAVAALNDFDYLTQAVDVGKISGDAVAADNLELQYDGTGLTGDAFPATQGSVKGIGTGTTGSINFKATGDNTGGPIKGATFVGSVVSGSYVDTDVEDGVVFDINDVGNVIDLVLSYDLGGSNQGTEVEVYANLSGNADQMDIQVYNFVTSAWEIASVLQGSGGSAFQRLNISLLAQNTGTGSDLGMVYVRFSTSITSPNDIAIDKVIVGAISKSRSVGYSEGSVWVSSTNGVSGVEPFVNGVADNPCASYANAISIASSVGLSRYKFDAGDLATLTQSHATDSFSGYNYRIDMNNQAPPTYVEGAEIVGTCNGPSAHYVRDCRIGTVPTVLTLNKGAVFANSGLVNLALLDSAGAALDVEFLDCHGNTQGSMFTGGTVDFGTTAGTNHEVSFQRWGGPVTIVNLKAGDTVYAHGNGTFILDASCTGGSFRVAGMINLVDNSSLVSVLEDGRITKSGIADAVWDEAQPDHTTAGTMGERMSYVDDTISNVILDIAAFSSSAPTNWSDLIIGTGADLGKVTTSNPASGGGSAHTAADVRDLILAGDKTPITMASNKVSNVVLVDTTTDLTNGGSGGDDAATIYTYFTSVSREDVFKADVSALALETTVDSVGTAVATVNSLVQLTPTSTYSLFTSGSNEDVFKADVSALATSANLESVAIVTLATNTAVNALNDFDPAVDVVANVTLVDTTTDVTNQSATGPTAQEIVDAWGNQPQGVYTTPDTLGFYLDAQVSTAGSGGTGLYQATVRVQDSSNNALQGARVNVDGTTLTLTTDSSGEVTFNLDSGVYLLEVSPPANYDTPVGQVLTIISSDPADTTFTLTTTSPPTGCTPPWIG